jgi:hypothetical protein
MNVGEWVLFSDLDLRGNKLPQCEIAFDGGDMRVYYSQSEDENGFEAACVEFASCAAGGDHWLCPQLRVQVTFRAIARFDGVRHLHFNHYSNDEDNKGYLYYPSIKGLRKALSALEKLEKKYCREI